MKESFEDFKRLIKEWLDTHRKEYGSFVEEMDRKDLVGIQKVFKLANKIASKYQGAVIKRLSDDTTDDFKSLETTLIDANIAEKIVREFHSMDKKSIVPAMLAWLYYGRYFENLVERCDNLRKDKRAGVLYRWILFLAIKYTIYKSISSGIRSKEDWIEFKQYSQLQSVDCIVDSTFEENDNSPKKKIVITKKGSAQTSKRGPGRQTDERTLEELLKPKEKEWLLAKIKAKISENMAAKELAYLKIALQEKDLLHTCGKTAFCRALTSHYGINFKNVRGVRDAEKELTSLIGNTGKRIADIGEDRQKIDAFKAFISE